ncbi:MAG: diaminopimelate epimerase [Terriglobia bacterium]
MPSIPFTKAHGAGNDFLIVDLGSVPSPDWIQRICDRHCGMGADGVLLLTIPGTAGADADLRIFNSDGGEAEISGNGTRCAAAWLVEARGMGPRLAIRTGAGVKRLALLAREAHRFSFEMEMGRPVFSANEIPFRPGSAVTEPIVDFTLPLADGSRRVTITSMGNPHCSLLVEDFDCDWQALGAEIERHPFFPNRTNVEFCRVVAKHEIEVRFWERGVGMTLSSGTGSCAAAVAAILNQKVASPVSVKTPAGELIVRWDPESVFLTGPAEMVCRGEFFAP